MQFYFYESATLLCFIHFIILYYLHILTSYIYDLFYCVIYFNYSIYILQRLIDLTVCVIYELYSVIKGP